MNYLSISLNLLIILLIVNESEMLKCMKPEYCKLYPESCEEANENGVVLLQIDTFQAEPFHVYCDNNSTIIQRRTNGEVDFDRSYESYRRGFGHMQSEFFLGLDRIHALTNVKDYKLIINLKNSDQKERYAEYDNFQLGEPLQAFPIISLGEYVGNAGDSLVNSVGTYFATREFPGEYYNQIIQGGWWYDSEGNTTSNLNGQYRLNKKPNSFFWEPFASSKLVYSEMRLLPRNLKQIC